MSNYLFIVADARRREAVGGWLLSRAAESELFTAPLGGRRTLFIVSRHVDRCVSGSLFQRGTVVSDGAGLVLGPKAWREAGPAVSDRPGDHDGEYVVADWSDGSLRIDRDIFGNARLLTTEGRGFAAASDSLLVLAALRSALGERVDEHDEALLARTEPVEVVGQQISPDTIIRQIGFVPACRGLRIPRLRLGWRLTGDPVADRLPRSAGDVDGTETIRSAAARMASLVATVSRYDGWSMRLNLSGGYDSRLVLAAAVRANCADRLRITTHDSGPRATGDIEVALSLAESLHLPIEVTRDPARPDEHQDDEFTRWAASLLGVYDGYGFLSSEPPVEREFLLTGLGAGIAKGGWDRWRTRDELLARISPGPETVDAVAAQFDAATSSLAADPGLADWGDCYYLGYRNGLHSAAGHIGRNMTGIAPIMQFSLARLAHTPATGRRVEGAHFLGSDRLILDLTALLSPELVAMPYEKDRAHPTFDEANERVRALGGPLPPVEPLTVHGHPDDVVSGPSEFSLALARDAGFDGPLTSENALRAADEAVDLVRDPQVRRRYAELAATGRRRIAEGSGLRATGVVMPRVSMLQVLRLAS